MQIYQTYNLITIYNSDTNITVSINKTDLRFIKEYDMLFYEDMPKGEIHTIGAYFELFTKDNTSFTNSQDAYDYLLLQAVEDPLDFVQELDEALL